MAHTYRVWIASDDAHGRYVEVKRETFDIMDFAAEYGRAEFGEVISLDTIDGTPVEDTPETTVFWDSQYRKYRRRNQW